MKKYFVDDHGLKWTFNNLEKAEKKAAEIGGKVESRIFWQYYAPYYTNLESAITANFNQILKDYDMEGLSGHILHYAALEKSESGAELIITLTKLEKIEKPGEKISKRIQIEGVELEDMENEKIILFKK